MNKKPKIQADRTTHTSESIKSDKILKTIVHVEEMPKEIEFQDIVDACEIVPDENPENPFDNDCGSTHELKRCYYGLEFDDQDKSLSYVYWERNWHFIDLSTNDCMTSAKYWQKLGASKQVAAEKVAQEKREVLKHIQEIYQNGYECFGVTCNFLDEEESIWGYYAFDDAESDKEDVANMLAERLIDRGFIIKNRPEPWKNKVENFKWKLKHNKTLFTTGKR